MEESKDWAAYQRWHELLDAVCAEQGHLDNLRLADQMCAAKGNRTHAAFETAEKNLRNWRHGVHIPQRRSFLLLTKLLKIDGDRGLREQWNELYNSARTRTVSEIDERPSLTPMHGLRLWQLVAVAAAIVGVLGVSLVMSLPLLQRSGETENDTTEWIEADYRKSVVLKVGDALIIHGARGNDCGPAPEWEVTRTRLPELATGTLSDGGLGTRYSRQCDGRVAARAILFTATAQGREQTTLYGDPVTITVQ